MPPSATFAFILLFIVGTGVYSLMNGRGFWGLGWGAGGQFDIEHTKLDREIAEKEKAVAKLILKITEDTKAGVSTTRAKTSLRKKQAELEKLQEARKWVARA